MSNNTLFAIAYKYHTLGRCVIPSGSGHEGKAALIQWKRYQTERPTDQQLETWQRELNPKVWAMPTGPISDIFVVDCDTPEATATMEAAGLKPHVKTRKGHHYYCKWPSQAVANSSRLLPGIDIRGHGGYVNFCGKNGKTSYEVLIWPTDDSIITVEQLPSELQKALKQKPKTLAERLLQEALDRAQPGKRNDTGLWLACQLRDNGLSQSEAEAIMRKYTAQVDNSGKEPYIETEAMATLHQAYTRPVREPRHKMQQVTAIQEIDDTPVIPKLPAIAWQGLLEDYRDLVAETTEAADAFHYATFCQVLGCTLGRRLHVYHATKLYPNFFICLVGRSGLTRKDTCWARASDLLNSLHADCDSDESPPFRIVKGIRSYEGLLDELSGERKVRLIQLGELLSLLTKAQQKSLGNIIPQLTELYDCPDHVNPPIHQKIVDCREPFVSIIAGTTQAWLQKAMTERDIYGGFANRWLYFFGLPKEPKPNPPKVDSEKRQGIVEAINTIRLWTKDVLNGELTISGEANALFAEYYNAYYRRCQQDGLIPTLIVRIQDFVWKLALLYAAIDLSNVIREDHINPAIAVGKYLESSVTEVFRTFGVTKGKQLEIKVRDYIKSTRKPIPHRDLYRNLNLSARELDTIVEPLIKLGIIRDFYARSKTGKRIRMLEAL